MEKVQRGIIQGSNTRYTEGTEVKIIVYCQSTNEYLVQPIEGQTQCWVKPDDLNILYPKFCILGGVE